MKRFYLQEWKEYTKHYILENKLEGDKETFDKLLKYAIFDEEKGKFQVKFVGVVIINDFVINCYPKYIPKDIDDYQDDFKQVLKVIKKYGKLNENIDYHNDKQDDISYNQLSMMIFFLEDYYEMGVYKNTQKTFQINGNGEIDWNRTINYTFPLIKDNKPYYVELYTKYNLNDLNDYFRLLHEYIITTCSKRLEEAGLLDLFDLTPVELSDKDQENFGTDDFILNKLKKELNVEFNSHKRKLLKSMHTFIEEKNSFSNQNFLTVYGTSKYDVIWEEMCSKVFKNKLKCTLNELNLEDCSDKRLIDVIEKPIWIINDIDKPKETKPLEPDLITFHEDTFIILDAKYYNLDFSDDNLTGQPGLESVTKQYLYELAYKEFIKDNKFKHVKNAFLFPTYDENIENKGCVKLRILSDLCFKESLEKGLEDIQVIMIPAKKLNQMYLENNNKYFGIEDLIEIL